MRVDVRSRDKSHKLNRSLLFSIEQLFQKLGKFAKDPAYIEVTLEHLHSRKKGGTHYVHASAVIPGEPTTFHAESLAEDFRTACDKVFDKMERHLKKRGNKLTRMERSAARRGKIDRWMRDTLHAPGRLLTKLRDESRRTRRVSHNKV
jgi:ribosomal subunit interface protein